MRRLRLFLVNAVILTATSLLLNGMGVWFNIYIADKLGASGMGIFQLILNVYSFAVTIATSGIYLAATRLVAEELASCSVAPPSGVKGVKVRGCGGVQRAMSCCLVYSLLFGLLTGVLLFVSAPVIGNAFLGCPQAIRPLRAMALGMPLLSMSCAIGGYFTAVRRVAKTSAAQIFEQFAKITLTVVLLTLFCPPDLGSMCLAIAVSGLLAEAVSFVLLWALYLFDKRRYRSSGAGGASRVRKLLHIALPVACSSYLRSGLMTVKNLLVPSRLVAGGVAQGAALAMFGAVHGLALPVILFPAALLGAFSSLIVPEMAENHSKHLPVEHMVSRMFSLNLTVSLGVCGVLFCFSTELGAAISQNPDVGVYIRLLAPVIPIMYLDTAVDSMLKGLDEQVSVMRYNVYDALLSLGFVWVMLPISGIKGYIFMIVLSEVFNFALSFRRLVMVTRFRLDIIEQCVKPLLCAALACVLTHTVLMSGFFGSGSPFTQAAVCAIVSGALYLLLLLFSGTLRRAAS